MTLLHRIVTGCAALGVVLTAAFAMGAPPASLDEAPASLALAAHHGDVVVVDFWASWCKPCQASLPWLGTMQTRHGQQGLTIVTVNVDHERKLADRFLSGLPTPMTVVYDPDGKVAEAFDLQGMPTSYVYDRSGKLRATHLGFHPDDVAALESELTGLLAEGGEHDPGL